VKKRFLGFLFLIFFSYQLEAVKKEHYRYQLAAALVFQNETFFLKEWLEYHKLVGFEHFYLFNNSSTDNYMKILKPYIDRGEVELFNHPQLCENQPAYNAVQCGLYNQALQMAKGKVKWLALIDADEFIVSLKGSILDKLEKYQNVGGVYINWLIFGTSNVEKVPKDKLITETLLYCCEKPMYLGKNIVRPERVTTCISPHEIFYYSPYYHVNANGIQFEHVDTSPISEDDLLIFHYCVGDLNYLTNVKFKRRGSWTSLGTLDDYINSIKHFNAVYNDHMKKYSPKLKKAVFKNKRTK
jgi:hypothetical protein